MTEVRLAPWSEAGFEVLVRSNAPEMKLYLGGPETDAQVIDRHRRYLALEDPGAGQMFLIMADDAAAGAVGYWEHEWNAEQHYESGWSVLPEFQGRGLACAGLLLVIERARAQQRFPTLHAFPSVENGPSNGVCRKAGMTLLGAIDFEYPPGHPLRCNDWSIEL